MPITLTVLSDNTAHNPGLSSEHGFSLALEFGRSELWLLDTGASGRFLDNARAMAIDPASLRGVILSHGHYDHTGGLAALARSGWMGPVFGHPHVLKTRYKIQKGHAPESIGVPEAGRRALSDRFIPLPGVWTLRKGMTLLTNIPRLEGNYEAIGGFALDSQGRSADHVLDDAALVLDTARGAVLVLGCSHSGLANILGFCRAELGLQRIHAVVGGLHLNDAPEDAVAQSGAALRTFDVAALYAGHCTGKAAFRTLDSLLQGHARTLGVGRVMSFPSS